MINPIYQLLYVSSAAVELTEEALLELLYESQSKNAARNISGLLLHSDGSIIQILEGEKIDVENLYLKIEQDPRHKGVIVLSRKHVEKRDFPEYKMGFRRTNKQTLESSIPGFSDLVDRRYLQKSELTGISNLVAIFLKTFSRTAGIQVD